MTSIINDRSLSGRDFSVHLSLQTESGVIQPNPEFLKFRRTDQKITKTYSATTSNEIKTDRQGRSNVIDTTDIAGDIPFELTQQTIPYFAAAIHSVEDDNSSAGVLTIAATSTGFDDSSDTVFSGMVVGDWFHVSGFADSSIDGWYKILTKTDDGTVDTTFAPPATEASGASVNVASVKYQSGSTQCLYIGQNRVNDLSAAGGVAYETFYDGVINTLSIEIGESGIVTGTMGLKFSKEVPGSSAIVGQTDGPEDVSDPVSSGGDKFVTPFYLDGEKTDQKCDGKSFSLSTDNGYQDDRSAGCAGARQVLSDPTYTGNLVTRARVSESRKWQLKSLNQTRVGVAVEVHWDDGKAAIFEIPQAFISSHTQNTGINSISSNEMELAAEGSPDGGTIRMYLNNWA